MTAPLKEELLRRRRAVERRKLVLGEGYRDYNLVFCLEDDRPTDRQVVQKELLCHDSVMKQTDGDFAGYDDALLEYNDEYVEQAPNLCSWQVFL